MNNTLVETYLKDDVIQSELFKDIQSEIENMLHKYDFKKKIFVEPGDHRGELIVSVQEDFPSQLIYDLNDYVGFKCIIAKTDYHIQLKYQIDWEDTSYGALLKEKKRRVR